MLAALGAPHGPMLQPVPPDVHGEIADGREGQAPDPREADDGRRCAERGDPRGGDAPDKLATRDRECDVLAPRRADVAGGEDGCQISVAGRPPASGSINREDVAGELTRRTRSAKSGTRERTGKAVLLGGGEFDVGGDREAEPVPLAEHGVGEADVAARPGDRAPDRHLGERVPISGTWRAANRRGRSLAERRWPTSLIR